MIYSEHELRTFLTHLLPIAKNIELAIRFTGPLPSPGERPDLDAYVVFLHTDDDNQCCLGSELRRYALHCGDGITERLAFFDTLADLCTCVADEVQDAFPWAPRDVVDLATGKSLAFTITATIDDAA